MKPWLVVLSFVAIALMRVVQKVCSKKVSNAVAGKESFRYGGYYQLLSTLFSLVTLFIVGVHGFSWQAAVCGLGTAIFLGIELFASIEALKGCSLIVSQMFSVGALFIPCLVGIFLFDEPMSVWQWVGLALFMVAMYFMVSPAKQKNEAAPKKMSLKTLILLIVCLVASGGTMVVQKVFSVLVPNGSVAAYSVLMFAFSALLMYAAYLALALIAKNRRKPNLSENLSENVSAGQAELTEATASKASKKRYKPMPKVLLICGAFLAFAVFVVNMLVTELGKTVESAILFSVSYAISIIITLLVGAFYYKEKPTWKNAIGIILCVGALAIINFL
ncbi:MAG: EamA family transporter [Clostridia bacterium]|nr:EamA family transporter [Clostridia bacterium]